MSGYEGILNVVCPMIRVDKESARAWVNDEADGVVFVWSANAEDQIEEFLARYVEERTKPLRDRIEQLENAR